MIYGSVCSGIEAATVAWKPLGWEAAFFSEIERFPCAVLAHHYPDVTNLGDMTKFKEWPNAAIDVLVGGTPCQSFSVAGLRKGLDDPRGNLMLTYLAIAERYRPKWLVWENVPGVLSSWSGDEPPSDLEEGREWESTETSDFGCFLAGFQELGYGFAYRIFDAQHFGVPQRRRRVFVVGYLGNWRPPAAVLFERESLSGNSAPSREKGEIAPTIPSRSTGGGGLGTDFDLDGGLVKGFHATGDGYWQEGAGTLRARGNDSHENVVTAFSCKDYGNDAYQDVSPTLRSINNDKSHQNGGGQVAVAHGFLPKASPAAGTIGYDKEICPTLKAGCDSYGVHQNMQVRRLTPIECERLQGFPDNYTRIAWGKKSAEGCPDGHRYKSLGNSMTVPVMKWLGERINLAGSLL